MTTKKRRTAKTRGTEISAAEFKAHCLGLMDDVALRGRSFVITKRGKPVAQLVPIDSNRKPLLGCMDGFIRWKDDVDLTAPTGEEWEAESK